MQPRTPYSIYIEVNAQATAHKNIVSSWQQKKYTTDDFKNPYRGRKLHSRIRYENIIYYSVAYINEFINNFFISSGIPPVFVKKIINTP